MKNKKDIKNHRFIQKPIWIPPKQYIPININKIIQKDLIAFKNKFKIDTIKPNLTENEIEALKSLRNNGQIIIKPADKRSAVVIQDRFQYLWECNRQLADRNYYIPLNELLFPKTAKLIKKNLRQTVSKRIY